MNIIDPNLGAADLLRSAHGEKDEKGGEGSKALQEFDAYFLAQILKGAQPEGEESLLDGGSAGRMYRDYFYEEVARVLSEKGDFGVTKQLEDSVPASASEEPEEERETPA